MPLRDGMAESQGLSHVLAFSEGRNKVSSKFLVGCF